MKYRKILFEIFVSMFFLMFTSTLLWSGEPEELVKEIILKDTSLKGAERTNERKQKLWEEISHSFDFEEMSKRAMGKYWRKRSPEEKREFVELFTNTLKGAYARNASSCFGDKIISLREKQFNKYAKVQAELITKIGKEKTAIFRLLKKNGKWKIYDINIEGVSVVKNYSSQINYILVESSYEELVQKMKQKQRKKSL
ncbi:MAG: ABC transporter substrate-binding protein [Candidatus Scalinduaceae bacterium]